MNPNTLQPQDPHPNEPLLEAGLVQAKQIGEETNSLLETIIHQNEINNPEPILEATLTQSIKNTDRLASVFGDSTNAISTLATILEKVAFLQGEKGEPGEPGQAPTDEELLALIRPLIPAPIKGDKGDTPTNEELLALIRPLIPAPEKGKDGKTPTTDELLDIITPLIPKAKDVKIDYKKIVKEVVSQIPPVEIEPQVEKVIEQVSIRTNDTIQTLRHNLASRTYAMRELEDTQSATLNQVMVKQADGSWAPQSLGAGSKHTVQDEGVSRTARTNLNFVGSGVSVTDDAGNDATVVTVTSGGSLADGNYTDVTVSGTGTVISINPGAVVNADLANMTTKTYKGRTSATTGAPEDVPVATLKSDLALTKTDVGLGNVDNTSDATKNSATATLTNKTISGASNTLSAIPNSALTTNPLARANHTGTQLASTISDFATTVIATVLTGFAAAGTRTAIVATDTILVAFGKVQKYLNDLATVAFSGLLSDTTGNLPTSRGGAPTGGTTGQVLKKNSATDYDYAWGTDNTGGGGLSDADYGDITVSGGATVFTIDANVVTNAKSAQMAANTIKGNNTGALANASDLTATQTTAMLDTFTSALKGLVPPSGGGTTTFLRADGTFATPTASASPAGSTTQIQYNNAGALGGASKTTINANGSLELLDDNSPVTPSAGELGLVSKNWGAPSPTVISPDGHQTLLQNHFGRNAISFHIPLGNSTSAGGGLAVTAVGTATISNVAVTNYHSMTRRIDYLVTVAATTAVAGWRSGVALFTVGHASNPLLGGFRYYTKWGPATGVATASATHRAFVGMIGTTGAPTDVNPSTLVNCFGMGWDSGDTNVQFMHNDATGACTKIDLGANFPRPSADRTDVYELYLYASRGTTQSVSYRVVNLTTGNEASGTVTTDLPATTALLAQRSYFSVGGTSSVAGFAHMGHIIETSY